MEAVRTSRRGRTIVGGALVGVGLVAGLLACGPASRPGTASPGPSRVPSTTTAPTVVDATPPSTATRIDPVATSSSNVLITDPSTDDLPVVDVDDPAVMARPVPPPPVEADPGTAVSAPFAATTSVTADGKVAVGVGCADGLGAAAIDRFLAGRVGPVLGWDYQHVYPLGGDRYLWLFQDAFVDHTGAATDLGAASFVHNAALVQQGACFTLVHGGTPVTPLAFEVGDGTGTERGSWFWPMGGEISGGRLWVFWAKMEKDGYDPTPPNGLGWHPTATYLASYDRTTLVRTSFAPAPNAGVAPIYGDAVAGDGTYSYLFGNTFEQNLIREGGYANAPHSATRTWLARVPQGHLWEAPEYRTADGWSTDPSAAVPIQSRFTVEDPMQPRFLGGRWVSVSKVDGYWGDDVVVDTAVDPWGPWTTTDRFRLVPRDGDTARNTYHAHLLPWLGRDGSLLVTVSNNARNMRRDAWPHPERYRPMVFSRAMPPVPVPVTPPAPVPDDSATTSTTTVVVASEPATVTTEPTATTSPTVPPTTTPVVTTTTATATATPTTVPVTTEAPTTTSSTSTSTTSTPTSTSSVPDDTVADTTAPPG